jgi:hypothetical protein
LSDVVDTVYVEQPATPITGGDTVCVDHVIILDDSTTGGSWTTSDSSKAIVYIGFVTALSPGLCSIGYTVVNACGTSSATEQLTILETAICDSLDGFIDPVLKNGVTFYPNPVQNELIICNTGLSAIVTLYDLMGRLLGRFPVSGYLSTMNLSEIQSGIYVISYVDERGYTLKQIIRKQ